MTLNLKFYKNIIGKVITQSSLKINIYSLRERKEILDKPIAFKYC